MYNASTAFKNAMLSPTVKLYIKIQLFDNKMKFIREISKQVTKDIGTLAINGDSPIRRSFKLTLDNSNGDFTFGEKNLIWLNKRIKLFIGLQTWNGTLEWVPQGVYIITDLEDNHTLEGKTATINAVDKAFFMTNNRGKFVNEFTIAEGAKISDTIKTIAGKVGETLFNFDTITNTVPYEITYSPGDNYWKAIQELSAFAKCTVSYDVNGHLRLKKIDLNEFDNAPITWTYKYGDIKEKLYAGNIRTMDTSNLFNDIVVVGGNSQNNTVRYRLTVDENNSIWADNPYSIQKIGYNTMLWNDGNADVTVITQDDAKFRAKYELMKCLGFTEKIQLTIAPNYLHDVDDVIYLQDKENGINGNKYLIKSINLPLSPSLMEIECVRYQTVISDWNAI